MDTLKKFVVTYYNDYNFDMTDDWEYDWDFPKAWLFTITLMTTVGYGKTKWTPKTFRGKMFCILYSSIGKSKLRILKTKLAQRDNKGQRIPRELPFTLKPRYIYGILQVTTMLLSTYLGT